MEMRIEDGDTIYSVISRVIDLTNGQRGRLRFIFNGISVDVRGGQ